MATTSPVAGSDATVNPSLPLSSVTISSDGQQQQPIPQPIPQQQLQASSTIHNTTSTPHQPLFLKPHPTILPTYTTNATNIGATTSATSSNTASPPKLPLATQSSPQAAPVNPHFVKGEGVKEPLPTDVICGRGKMTASHPANRRFRELVDSHKASYQNSKRRDEKTRITCELVDKLRQEGRFVLFDPNTKLWHEVSEEYAREKVSHSLRSRSSTEQRIANAANNSIKMLNQAAAVGAEEVVSIAPHPPKKVEKKTKPPQAQHQQPSVHNHKAKPAGLAQRKKQKVPVPHKARSSKHLKPGLDEIVKRLIQDQQKLLRMMIQKETDRFTSAAALGSSNQPPPMPLSYKAEASAVSKLTESLPKLEEDTNTDAITTATGVVPTPADANDPRTSKNETSTMPTVAA